MVATALKSLALGLEGSTYGTPNTRTAKLAGLLSASFNPMPEIYIPPELGRLGPSKLAAKVSDAAAGKFEIAATYEHLIYILQGIFGAVSASGTSGSAQFTYPFSAPSTSVPTPGIYTMEWTDSADAYLINGALLDNIKISGKAGEVWMASCDVIAKSMTTAALTTTLTDPSPLVNLIRMADTALYLDGAAGTMGATAVSATLREFELSIQTGYHRKLFAGAMTPGSYGADRWNGALKLTLEANTTSKALFDALISTGGATVVRQVEIKGTQSTTLVSRLQINGVIDNHMELWPDGEGNRLLEVNFAGLDSTTLGNWLKVLQTIGSSTIS